MSHNFCVQLVFGYLKMHRVILCASSINVKPYPLNRCLHAITTNSLDFDCDSLLNKKLIIPYRSLGDIILEFS